MSNFIHGEEPFKQGEKILWKAVKSAFSNREVLGYYKYPLFFNVGEKRKEPDILLIDKKIGLIEIEVSELTLDKIQKKDSIKISEQIAQAADYGIWYMDVSERPDVYVGKKVRFKGQGHRKAAHGNRPEQGESIRERT